MDVSISYIIPIHKPNIEYLNNFIDSLINIISDKDEAVFVLNGNNEEENRVIIDVIEFKQSKILIENIASVSKARNIGLSKAVNEFICFLDCDDLVSENFSSIIKQTVNENYDLIMYGDTHVLKDLGKKGNSVKLDNAELHKCIFFADGACGVEIRSIWAKIFRRSIILKNNIRFNENQKLGEDTLFLCEYSLFCNNCLINTSRIYYYRQDDYESGLKYYIDIKKRVDVLINNYRSLIIKYKLDANEDSQLDFVIINEYFLFICMFYIYHSNSGFDLVKQTKMIKAIFQEETYNRALKNSRIHQFSTIRKKAMVFFLKCHLLFIVSFLLRKRYYVK